MPDKDEIIEAVFATIYKLTGPTYPKDKYADLLEEIGVAIQAREEELRDELEFDDD